MKKSRFTAEQITYALKQVAGGAAVGELCRKLGVSEQTFYTWKKKYGGMEAVEVHRLNQLQDAYHAGAAAMGDSTVSIPVPEPRGWLLDRLLSIVELAEEPPPVPPKPSAVVVAIPLRQRCLQPMPDLVSWVFYHSPARRIETGQDRCPTVRRAVVTDGITH